MVKIVALWSLFLLFSCLTPIDRMFFQRAFGGIPNEISEVPAALLDYRSFFSWYGFVRANNYSYADYEFASLYSTELEYWLFDHHKKIYYGPMSRSEYISLIEDKGLGLFLQLATWKEILKVDYSESFASYTGPLIDPISYYFYRKGSFSDPPQKIVEKKKEYFDEKVIPDGIAPYVTRHPYPDAERPWLSEDSGECSWQLKHNRRNYFNNFYRDFGYGGELFWYKLHAGEINPEEQEYSSDEDIVKHFFFVVENLTEGEKKINAHYARQLEAMQQAFNNGDTAELKRLEDQALAESQRNYPCP